MGGGSVVGLTSTVVRWKVGEAPDEMVDTGLDSKIRLDLNGGTGWTPSNPLWGQTSPTPNPRPRPRGSSLDLIRRPRSPYDRYFRDRVSSPSTFTQCHPFRESSGVTRYREEWEVGCVFVGLSRLSTWNDFQLMVPVPEGDVGVLSQWTRAWNGDRERSTLANLITKEFVGAKGGHGPRTVRVSSTPDYDKTKDFTGCCRGGVRPSRKDSHDPRRSTPRLVPVRRSRWS